MVCRKINGLSHICTHQNTLKHPCWSVEWSKEKGPSRGLSVETAEVYTQDAPFQRLTGLVSQADPVQTFTGFISQAEPVQTFKPPTAGEGDEKYSAGSTEAPRQPYRLPGTSISLAMGCYPCAILPPPRTVPELVVLVSTIGKRQLPLKISGKPSAAQSATNL